MTMTPRLELRQSQALVMTPRLQQSIRMLQMSNLELADYVATVVEANPLLEEARPLARAGGGSGGQSAGDGVSAIDLAAAPVTLREHLGAQVRAASGARAAAALIIIDELDDDGYLRAPLEEVAARHGLADDAAAAGLALVQRADPAGVGARDLGECLALQLHERGALDAPMQALLDNLALLAGGRRAELAERCGVAQGRLAAMLETLRTLDPRPGARFATEPVALAVPDVFVRRGSAGLEVELNTETLPRLLVNNVYAAKIAAGDRAARQFISECRAQASWLVRSLEQRARTILTVAEAIVHLQERFFAHGVSGLRPLSQRALADLLALHESTISRVTAGKYLACDRGVFPLRFFFSQAVLAVEGGPAFAAAAVQDRIRALIQNERPPRTLSDDKIVAILQGEGIDIARRTVAKYRGALGIPSSVARRRRGSGAVGT